MPSNAKTNWPEFGTQSPLKVSKTLTSASFSLLIPIYRYFLALSRKLSHQIAIFYILASLQTFGLRIWSLFQQIYENWGLALSFASKLVENSILHV